MEAAIIAQGREALKNITEFRLAEKAQRGDRTTGRVRCQYHAAFNERVSSIYGNASLRTWVRNPCRSVSQLSTPLCQYQAKPRC